MKYEIVSYTEERVNELCDLMGHWGDIRFEPEVLNSRMMRIAERNEGFLLLALNRDSKAVGYLYAYPVLTPAFPVFLEIAELLVHPEHRNQGIGHILLLETEKRALRMGINTIKLSSQSFRDDAHRFYEREGFRRFKESVFFEKTLSQAAL